MPSLEGWLAIFFLIFLAVLVICIAVIFIHLTKK